MPTTLTNGIQLPDKGSVDWYSSMQSNYNLIDTHLGDTNIHVTAEDKANWDSKANASHTHTSSELTDIGDFATKQYVDNSISGLVDNAPDALNTLNELSAALNDDSNFASTVTTALAAKANSVDLATVATSGSYNDLSNKPTINDSTITIQKNGSTVDTFTTNGSAKTINIPTPTKTSDLTNDSNFVDTSNSAVASGITSAKVTDYDTHIADTDKHVTTADKNKWNNGVSQAYVLRYSSTAITASSTNSNALLDNTDNLKVGDKVIDSSGVLFSITAIDNVNRTFTIGTALIDLHSSTNVGAVALPIGSYIQFAGSQAPDGFLVCNGGEISRITYSELFAVIGTTYGSGDGSTTFNLPNLTDRFLQGSTTSGTVKEAGLPNITGYFGGSTICLGSQYAGAFNKYGKDKGAYGSLSATSSSSTSRYDFDASRSSSIYGSSSTVQPPALTCLICIKY